MNLKLDLWEHSYRKATRKNHIPSVEEVNAQGNSRRDSIQNAYLKAYERLDKYDPTRGTFSSWMYWTIYKESHNDYKKGEKEIEVLKEYKNYLETGGLCPTFTQEQLLMAERLANDCKDLTQKQKLCFFLHLDGFTYQEIGGYISTSKMAAWKLCHRASCKLFDNYLEMEKEMDV